jgi:hypothetical protein
MSWIDKQISLERGSVIRHDLWSQDNAVSYDEVLRLWQHDTEFRSFFLTILRGSAFAAFRWETPPITTATLDRPFEFVLIDTPELDRRADPDAFAEHFRAGDGSQIAAFPNLGKDAVLIVPKPATAASEYAHLAAFLRSAPESQKHELWQTVGQEMLAAVGESPRWLSTAGLGVPWLHLRIDSRPKYYAFAGYR